MRGSVSTVICATGKNLEAAGRVGGFGWGLLCPLCAKLASGSGAGDPSLPEAPSGCGIRGSLLPSRSPRLAPPASGAVSALHRLAARSGARSCWVTLG